MHAVKTIAAIPGVYRGVQMRSRLEVKWAAFFDALKWRWDYESIDFAFRIPDFLMDFRHPTIIECKPAVSVGEFAMYTAGLVTSAADWLCADAELRIAQLDAAPDRASDLAEIDACIEHIAAVHDRRENARGPGRRALIAGSTLHVEGDVATIDGTRRLAWCSSDHAGLIEPSGLCLVCGERGFGQSVPSSTVLEVWRSAGNAAQWRPPT